MSFQAMAWAVKQKVGNATGKAILIMLANYADEKGECFPSQERLAAECECSVASVARWLKAFQENGLIDRKKQYGEGGYRRADRLRLNTNLPVTELPNNKLPSTELPNFESNLTRHSDGAEPIKEPINTSSLRSEDISAPAKKTDGRLQVLATVLSPKQAKAVHEYRLGMKAKWTQYAAELLTKQFAKVSDPDAAADEMILRGWQSFKAEWLKSQSSGHSKANSPPSNGLSEMNAALDRMISGQTDEPDEPYTNTIDATFERGDRRGAQGFVQRSAVPARH